MSVYFILNACRVYAYVRDKSILSKDEGGVWAMRVLPSAYHLIIQQALKLYRGDAANPTFKEPALDAFAEYMNVCIKNR
jgi:streptomycin 3"-adenylyltransferase